MKSREDKIDAFWQWFVKNEAVIKECIDLDTSPNQSYVVNQMNELILDLGVFTWDMGLNEQDNWFLMISPNGNADNLGISQQLIVEAPPHIKWQFHSSRPAKNWDRCFTVHSFDMQEMAVDASNWNLVAIDQDDNQLEIIIEAKNIGHLDPETSESAANQFLVGELGEELRINRIAKVQIVKSVDAVYEKEKVSVSKLKKHVEVG